jgi:hypothetical protein
MHQNTAFSLSLHSCPLVLEGKDVIYHNRTHNSAQYSTAEQESDEPGIIITMKGIIDLHPLL